MNDADSNLIFEAYNEVASGPFGTRFKVPYHNDAVERPPSSPQDRLQSHVEEYLRKYVDRANFEMVAENIEAIMARVFNLGTDAGYKELKSSPSGMDAKQRGEFLDSYRQFKSSAVKYLRQYVNINNFAMVSNEIEDIIEKTFNNGVAMGRSSFNSDYSRTG